MVQDISRILSNTAPVECLHNCMRRSHCQKTQHRQDAAHQCRWGESEDRSVRTNKRPQNHRDERTRHPGKPGATARARHRPHTPTDLGMGYQGRQPPWPSTFWEVTHPRAPDEMGTTPAGRPKTGPRHENKTENGRAHENRTGNNQTKHTTDQQGRKPILLSSRDVTRHTTLQTNTRM